MDNRTIRLGLFAFFFTIGYLLGNTTKTIEHTHNVYNYNMGNYEDVVDPFNGLKHNANILPLEYDPGETIVPKTTWLCTTETCDDAGWVRQTADPTPVPAWVRQTADDDFECMATSIYFEAAIEPYEGKLAVGEVIMNRVDNDQYPDNVCDVIKQHRQFSWYEDGISNLPNKTTHSWRESERAAEEVMFSITSSFHPDVQYYHADYVDPYWNRNMTKVATIGAHIFYRL